MRPRPLRQKVRPETRRPQRAGLRHRRHPQGRASRLHVARRDPHVLEGVALAFEAELLSREGAPKHGNPLVGQGDAPRDRQAEAAELVRRIAHADADLHPSTADVVENREILGQPDGVVERQQADVTGEPDAPGARRHRRSDRNPGREISVLDEMMFREPDQIESEPVEPRHLVHDRGIQVLMAHAGGRRVAKIVSDAQAQWFGHRLASLCGQASTP